nr:MurR/RpiR family transcriptional regulator [Lysinibacillus timonensis]
MYITDEIKKRFIQLSRGQRKVAQFVVENPNIVATHIASEVGQLIGVSESTVIRFCYAMELSGFNELQEELKKELLKADGSSKKQKSVITKRQPNFVNEMMNRDVTSILNTIELIDSEQFDLSTQWLHESQFVYILGFRQSTSAASFMTSTLKNWRNHVNQIQHDMEDIVQQLSNMDSRSTLVIIAVDHTLDDVVTFAKLAKSKNSKIIALTNSTLSPIRDYADSMFTTNVQKQSVLETSTALCSLINALIEGMISQNKRQYISFQKSNAQIESNFTY